MFTALDFRGHNPIYSQLVDRIRHLVATGVLKPGDQLPTVRMMAAELGVNFNTIARAYRILDEEGVLSTQRGRGTYVLPPMLPDQALPQQRAALEMMTKSFLERAYQMGFSPDEVSLLLDAFLIAWSEEGMPPKFEG